MKRPGIGIQLYTLRQETAQDFRGTLHRVAELGYEGVEFAGYGDIPAAEMKALLDTLGLKAIGGHVSIEAFERDMQSEIDYLRTIGASYAIVPYIGEQHRTSADAWKATIQRIKQIGEAVTKQGLMFAYHNHAFEFETRLQQDIVFDAIFKEVSTAKVEMDIGWVRYADHDPIAYIAQYAGRLPLLHLKDFRSGEGDLIDTVELGRGELKLPEILQAASDARTEWIIVEQDHCANPPLESVETSIKWLQQHYLKLGGYENE